jgi:FkbM family methyltransferase
LVRRELDVESEFGSRGPGVASRLVWKLATHGALGSGTRRRIRKLLARHFPGPFDISVDGIRIRAYPLENYCDRIVLGRQHLPEIPERELIAPLLRPGMVFVDIGANIGTYSLFVANRCGGKARILSLEPHPETFSKLAYNVRANGFSAIETINQGVGPEQGRLRLYSSGGSNIGTASIVPEAVNNKHQVDIEIVPLGDLLKSRMIERVDLLKIDIEGFEDRALLPLMTPQNRPLWPGAILIETVLRQHWQTDCIARLISLGYSISGDTGENLLLLHPMTEKLES